MTSPFGPGYPYQTSFQTIPGVYGSLPAMANVAYPMPAMRPVDTFQRQQPAENPKKQSWYAKAGQELLKTGLVIGASVLGGLVGNVPGAMAAGAGAAGLVSVADQQWTQGKINWGSAAVDAAIGLIPAGFGNVLMKGAQSVLGKKLFEAAGTQTVKQVVAKGAALGALDGAAIGYASGMAHSAMESQQQTGAINWASANQSGLLALLPGALGGAVAGGAVTGLVRHYSGKSGNKPQPDTNEPNRVNTNEKNASETMGNLPPVSAEELKHLKPPKRTLFNRAMDRLTLHGKDARLGNFHKVDDHVFRGAMPESVEAIGHLKERYGVRTIIDLRGAETTKGKYIQFERGHAEGKGIKYVSLPMDSHVPPTREQLAIFLSAIEETKQSGGKVYVHCKHGIDRTGALLTAYEVLNGKTQAEAYKTMKRHGFNWLHRWERPELKRFVKGEGLMERLREVRPGWTPKSGA